DDAVAHANEGFQALLDVREDHQFVDDGVGGFGGDDARLGQAQVAAAVDALLGVADGGALHRAFHHARSATGADVQAAQAQFAADLIGVLVVVDDDGVADTAHDYLRLDAGAQGAGVAQQLENVDGDAFGAFQVEAAAYGFLLRVDDDAQGGEQHLA